MRLVWNLSVGLSLHSNIVACSRERERLELNSELRNLLGCSWARNSLYHRAAESSGGTRLFGVDSAIECL